jgi:hypothetical protein
LTTMPGELVVNSGLSCAVSASIRRTFDVIIARVKSRVTRHSYVRSRLIYHEYVFGCARGRQVGGRRSVRPTRRASGRKERTTTGLKFIGAESAVSAGNLQRIHDAIAVRVG